MLEDMRIIFASALFALTAACASPTAPTTNGPSAPVDQPFRRTGSGALTFELPASVKTVAIEIRSEQNACHYFAVFTAQQWLAGGVLGTCRAASGLTYSTTHSVTGPRIDIQDSKGTDHSVRPFTWTVEEIK